MAHFPVVKELTALGVRVDAAASTGCSIEARITAAQEHFWARRDQLLCRQVSLRARLSRLYQTVFCTLLWGAGGWSLNASPVARLEAFELSISRRVVRVPRLDGEGFVGYQQGSARIIRRYLPKHGLDTVVVRAPKALHGWSGHAAGLSACSPLRRLLSFRDLDFWPKIQELGVAWDPQNRAGWRHKRPGRHSRWESLLHGYTPDWLHKAKDRALWRHTLVPFLRHSTSAVGVRNSLQRDPPGCVSSQPPSGSQESGRGLPTEAPSLLSVHDALASLWRLMHACSRSRVQVVCLSHHTGPAKTFLGVQSCAPGVTSVLRDTMSRTLKRICTTLRIPWFKIFLQITQASNWQAEALAHRALEGKHSTEVWSPSELTMTPTPGVIRVFYAAVSKGSVSGAGVHITLQQDDSCGEVFSGSFSWGIVTSASQRCRPAVVLFFSSPPSSALSLPPRRTHRPLTFHGLHRSLLHSAAVKKNSGNHSDCQYL